MIEVLIKMRETGGYLETSSIHGDCLGDYFVMIAAYKGTLAY